MVRITPFKPFSHRGLGWALTAVVVLALPACDTYRFDPGNSPQGRIAKAAMRSYSDKNARKPDGPAPAMRVGGWSSAQADDGFVAPYLPCETYAECRDKARELDGRIGWTSADFPVGYRTELHQLRQVAGRGLAFDPADPLCHEYRAKAREALQDWDGAIEDVSAVLVQRPGSAALLVRRSRLNDIKGNLQAALEDASRALEIAPANVEAWVGRSRIRARTQDTDGALADANRALELEPGDLDALTWRAALRMQRREEGPALGDLERAMALRPNDGDLYALRGNVYESFDEPDLARADYRRACDLGNPYWCTLAKR